MSIIWGYCVWNRKRNLEGRGIITIRCFQNRSNLEWLKGIITLCMIAVKRKNKSLRLGSAYIKRCCKWCVCVCRSRLPLGPWSTTGHLIASSSSTRSPASEESTKAPRWLSWEVLLYFAFQLSCARMSAFTCRAFNDWSALHFQWSGV